MIRLAREALSLTVIIGFIWTVCAWAPVLATLGRTPA